MNPAMMALQGQGQGMMAGGDEMVGGADPMMAPADGGNEQAVMLIQGMLSGEVPFETTTLEQVLAVLTQGSGQPPMGGGF